MKDPSSSSHHATSKGRTVEHPAAVGDAGAATRRDQTRQAAEQHRWVRLLAVAYLVLLIHGSLVPYDFSLSAPSDARGRYMGLHLSPVSFPDVVSNIAIYVPLGLLLRAACGLTWRRAWQASLAALLSAVIISFTLEWLQTMLVSRVSSFADFACNLIGAGIGLALFRPEWTLARRTVTTAARQWPSRHADLLVAAWCGLIALAALAPFDFTFDLGMIAHAVKTAELVPLEVHARLVEQSQSAWNVAFTPANRALVALWHLRIDYVVDVVLFAVMGWLTFRSQRRRGNAAPSALAGAALKTLAFAVCLTAAALIVVTVGFDVTRMLTRSLGAGLGVFAGLVADAATRATATDPDRVDLSADRAGSDRRRLAAVCVGMSVAYITARQLVPFTFFASPDGPSLDRIEWLPFHAYTLERIPAAAMDALHKSFRYLVLGASVALACAAARMSRKRAYATAGTLAALIVTATEFAQLWLPGRVCALTDLLIATSMTLAGVWVGIRVVAFARASRTAESAASSEFVSSSRGTSGRGSPDRALFNAPIPPPDPRAPREQSPAIDTNAPEAPAETAPNSSEQDRVAR